MVSSTILVTLAALATISPALAYTNTREYSEDALLARELTDLFAREPRFVDLDARHGGNKHGGKHRHHGIHFHKAGHKHGASHGKKGHHGSHHKGDHKRDVLDLLVRTMEARDMTPMSAPKANVHHAQHGHQDKGLHHGGLLRGHKHSHGGRKGHGRRPGHPGHKNGHRHGQHGHKSGHKNGHRHGQHGHKSGHKHGQHGFKSEHKHGHQGHKGGHRQQEGIQQQHARDVVETIGELFARSLLEALD